MSLLLEFFMEMERIFSISISNKLGSKTLKSFLISVKERTWFLASMWKILPELWRKSMKLSLTRSILLLLIIWRDLPRLRLSRLFPKESELALSTRTPFLLCLRKTTRRKLLYNSRLIGENLFSSTWKLDPQNFSWEEKLKKEKKKKLTLNGTVKMVSKLISRKLKMSSATKESWNLSKLWLTDLLVQVKASMERSLLLISTFLIFTFRNF